MNADSLKPRRFGVALSFPGEHRRFVKNVANRLAEVLGKERVFYDEWYEAELFGLDGDLKLRKYYGEQSQMVVPFFSEHYEKDWCQIEWSAIRAMLKTRRKEDGIIPVQLDGTRISGWEENDFAIRKKGRSGRRIADLIIEAYRLRFPVSSRTPASLTNADRLRNLHRRFVEAQDRFPREVSFALVMIPHNERQAWKEANEWFSDMASAPPQEFGWRCLAFAGGGDTPETITIPASEATDGGSCPAICHLDSWRCWLLRQSTNAPYPSTALNMFHSLADDACRLLEIHDCGQLWEGQHIAGDRGKYQHLLRWSVEQLPAKECEKLTWLDPPHEQCRTTLQAGRTPRRWVVEMPCVFAAVAQAIERHLGGFGNPWPSA